MATSGIGLSKSGLYADPRPDWLALRQEEVIDPERPIVDPHHHLWDRDGQRYLIEDIAGDIRSFAAIGVHELILDFRGESVVESIARLQRFSAEVMPLVNK